MDLKKENSENIASKKEKMKMLIKTGIFLLEQLIEDFYTTNQELDKSYQLFIDQLFQKDNKISEPVKKHDFLHGLDEKLRAVMHVDKTFKIEEEKEKIINLGFILDLQKKDIAEQSPYAENEFARMSPFWAKPRVNLHSNHEIQNLDKYPLAEYPYYFELTIKEMAVKKIKSNLEELKNDTFNTSWNSKAMHELYDESNVLSSLIGCDLFSSIRACFRYGPINLILPIILDLKPETNKDLVIKGVCNQLKYT